MKLFKLVTILGARPQFIKAAAISRHIQNAYSDKIHEIIIHTGQHYDTNMSDVFFKQLDIPTPKYNLNISGGTHGLMTGRMLEAIENVLLQEMPDCVLVYGDTNSTLAGALSAAKLHIPIAHVEAGLRSFNMRMPEEINRIITDRISTLLFCPTQKAMKNLQEEGISSGVYQVGDVMYDISLFYKYKARQHSNILKKLNLNGIEFALATCHREESTNNFKLLKNILLALNKISKFITVVIPIHPRTRQLIIKYGLEKQLSPLVTIDPLPFFDMITLEQEAKVILTDSGGIQKEAFFFGVPCITMRDETEWTETVELGWNCLAGMSQTRIFKAALAALRLEKRENNSRPYGEGNSANQIVSLLFNLLSNSKCLI